MTHTKHVDLDNARVDEQIAVMEQIINDDSCPFCLEHLKKYHKQPLLKEGEYWIVTPNQWPYEHTKVHLLFIYKTHIEHVSEMTEAAGAELVELVQWATREYQIPGGALGMRFGDTRYSAGSVVHLHAQLIQPDLDDESYQPVRFKIGKNRDQIGQ